VKAKSPTSRRPETITSLIQTDAQVQGQCGEANSYVRALASPRSRRAGPFFCRRPQLSFLWKWAPIPGRYLTLYVPKLQTSALGTWTLWPGTMQFHRTTHVVDLPRRPPFPHSNTLCCEQRGTALILTQQQRAPTSLSPSLPLPDNRATPATTSGGDRPDPGACARLNVRLFSEFTHCCRQKLRPAAPC
jgi:hypothetical protein